MNSEATAEQPEVVATVEDGVGWITVNRPAASNAVRPETMRLVCVALDDMTQDDGATAIVLAGAGRHFMAGGDFGFLKAIVEGKADPYRDVYHHFQGAARRLFECPKPTIAAVSGAAITVGCELALACDVRLADRSAFFQESWLDLGLIPPLGGAMLLPRIVGLGLAKEMILEARRVGAEEALARGLVSAVVEDAAELRVLAQQRAKAMAQRSPTAFARAKQMIHRGMESTMGREWEAGVTTQALLLSSSEFRDRLASRLD